MLSATILMFVFGAILSALDLCSIVIWGPLLTIGIVLMTVLSSRMEDKINEEDNAIKDLQRENERLSTNCEILKRHVQNLERNNDYDEEAVQKTSDEHHRVGF